VEIPWSAIENVLWGAARPPKARGPYSICYICYIANPALGELSAVRVFRLNCTFPHTTTACHL